MPDRQIEHDDRGEAIPTIDNVGRILRQFAGLILDPKERGPRRSRYFLETSHPGLARRLLGDCGEGEGHERKPNRKSENVPHSLVGKVLEAEEGYKQDEKSQSCRLEQ